MFLASLTLDALVAQVVSADVSLGPLRWAGAEKNFRNNSCEARQKRTPLNTYPQTAFKTLAKEKEAKKNLVTFLDEKKTIFRLLQGHVFFPGFPVRPPGPLQSGQASCSP